MFDCCEKRLIPFITLLYKILIILNTLFPYSLVNAKC
jgi:hypothetical protein